MSIFWTLEAQTRDVPIMDVVVEPVRPPETERPALRALVDGFSKHVKSVARCWGVPARDVDDVAQEAFLRVNRALPRYYPHSVGHKPWLTKITIRAARDYLRRNALREVFMSDETIEEPVDQAPSAEDCARFAQAERIACAIMRGLPDKLREVYQLHLDGADEPYIAELTELPVTTVHKRLHHARMKVDAAVAELHRKEERRAGPASAMLPLLTSPEALFAAAKKAPPEPGFQERLLAHLAKAIGPAALSMLHVVGLGAAILGAAIFGAGTGTMTACAAQPVGIPAIVMNEHACEAPMETTASARVTAAPPESLEQEKGSARGNTTVQLPRAEPPRAKPAPRLWAERSKIDAARTALTKGDAEGARALLIEHARTYPFSQLKSTREALLQRAIATLQDGREGETP